MEQKLSLRHAAELLDVSTKTVRRWIAEGKLPAEQLASHSIRVNESDVEKLLKPIPTVDPR